MTGATLSRPSSKMASRRIVGGFPGSLAFQLVSHVRVLITRSKSIQLDAWQCDSHRHHGSVFFLSRYSVDLPRSATTGIRRPRMATDTRKKPSPQGKRATTIGRAIASKASTGPVWRSVISLCALAALSAHCEDLLVATFSTTNRMC